MQNIFLNKLEMENFKCFSRFEMRYGRLTVLSGFNGTGKSTTIHPILLLSQALNDVSEPEEYGKYWPLNGELIRLGTAGDVVNDSSDDDENVSFSFGLSDGRTLSCELVAEKGNGFLTCNNIDNTILKSLNFISRLSFISAVRGGVEHVYPIPDKSNYAKVGVGSDGRYASFLFDKMEGESKDFRSEVEKWLNFITPGARAQVQSLIDISLFSLGFKLTESSDYRRPINIGYGLTYAFPIIVALLAANEGDFLVIDSPEAHLHPRAQSRMGIMLAEIAAKGIQIVVETHSDHVLNGIRLAVKEEKLMPEDLSILFFSDVENETERVSMPLIDKYGNLDKWPEGFFDQFIVDSAQLIGYERNALVSE